jgi:hypothetical protein
MPQPAWNDGSMLLSRLFRLRRRKPVAPATAPALDRSTLLAELEVAVPAPERLVRWDTALSGGRGQRRSST